VQQAAPGSQLDTRLTGSSVEWTQCR